MADRLPLDLGTYKFLGGEPNHDAGHATNLLFSGPIQFNEREEDNFISFNVETDRTFVRFYLERATVTLTLEQLAGNGNTHPKQQGTGSQAFSEILSRGQYLSLIHISEPTRH